MRTSRKKQLPLILLNVVLPLIAGLIAYLLFNQSILLFRLIHIHLPSIQAPKSAILILMKNYFADFMWAYAFSFALVIISVYHGKKPVKGFVIAVSCQLILELFQMIPGFPMTFDFWDIFIEVSASFIAFFISCSLFHKT